MKLPSSPRRVAHSRRAVCGLLLAALSLSGCARDAGAPARAERVDSAGITIVRNTGEDRPLEWSFEPVMSIGGADDGPEAFFNVGERSIATDATGNIYVLDAGNHRVVVFDSTGAFIRSVGSEGGGPGEMQFPSAFAVAPSGAVSVLDPVKRGLVSWGPDGELLPSQPLDLSVAIGGGLARTPSATILPVSVTDPATEQGRYDLLAIREGGTDTIATMPRPQLVMKDYGCVGLNIPPLFTPSLNWAALGDTMAVNAGAEYTLDVYEGSHRRASIRRDLAPRPVTRELALQEIGEERRISFGGGAECRIPAEKLVDTQGYAPVLPAIQTIRIDPARRLWVQRGHIKDEPTAIDVFHADGEYLGTLPPGTPFPAAFSPNGGIVTVEMDELDVPRVVVYRIFEKERG